MVIDIPAGDGKLVNLFLRCTDQAAVVAVNGGERRVAEVHPAAHQLECLAHCAREAPIFYANIDKKNLFSHRNVPTSFCFCVIHDRL